MGKTVKISKEQAELIKNTVIQENVSKISNRFFSNVLTENRVDSEKDTFLMIENTYNQLEKEGYTSEIIEEGMGDFLGNLGSMFGKGALETLKQRIITSILNLGIFDSIPDWAKRGAAIGLANIDISDYPKLFSPSKNCEFILNKMMDGMLETFVDYMGRKLFAGDKPNAFFDILRDGMTTILNDEGFVEELEVKLASKMCPILRQGISKMMSNVI